MGVQRGSAGPPGMVLLELRRSAERGLLELRWHRGAASRLRAGAAAATGRWRDESAAAGVCPGAEGNGSTSLAGDGAGDGGGGRTLESHPLSVSSASVL